MRELNEIIVHCSATRPEWMVGRPVNEAVEEIRRWHREKGWRDIGYHFVIDRAGNVGIGRALGEIGAHVKGHNTGTIGICLLGGHGAAATDRFSDHFTSAQDKALRDLIGILNAEHPTIQKISGHNEYANKGCPSFQVAGWYVRDQYIRDPIIPAPPVRRMTFWQRMLSFLGL